MSGRFVRIALLALLVALLVPAASRSVRPDQTFQHKSSRVFLATCPGGPACIDLDVRQGDTPDPIPAGDRLTYRITLQNHGPDLAPDVFLTDLLPDNVVLSSPPDPDAPTVTTNVDTAFEGGPCSIDGNTVFCSFGDIENTDLNGPPNFPGPRVITVTVTPDYQQPPPAYPRTLTNTVAVASRGFSFDRNTDNNRSLENTTVTSPGDLQLTKTHPPDDPIPPSVTSYYQLKLTNTASKATLNPFDDSSPAPIDEPLTVTDTLPHGFQFIDTIDDPAHPGVDNRCTATSAGPLQNSVVTCHPKTSIAAGDFYTVYLGVNPTQTGTFTNFADAKKYGGDARTGDNSASDLTHVACPKPGTKRNPALCVVKTDSQDPVPQGKPFDYVIKVINERTGPEDEFSEPVTVRDTIPPGMTVQSTSGGACGPVSGGVLTCQINGGIPAGGSRSVVITLIALQVGTFENVGCIDIFERLTCGNQPTTIIGAADLMITKSASPIPVEVNSDLTYTIKVTNKGPASVPHVQVDDEIPANTTFVSSSVSPGTADCNVADPANLHCDFGTMGPTTSKTLTVVVRPTAPGTISNTAKVANDGTTEAPVDFDLTNNSATVVVDARPADLAITKVAAPTPVGVGQPLTYTIIATNNGPGVASNVEVVDDLPSAVSSPQMSATKGTCAGTTTITCSIGVMDPAETVTITIQVTPVTAGTATNTARVNGDSFDPDPSNNEASATVTITPTVKITPADVAISKTAGPNPVAFGTTLTYTLTVTNNGPARATGVTVRDTLPDGVALPTVTPSQGTCFGAPTITCVLGDLNASLTATVTIVVTPLVTSGTITNNANVTSAFDLNSANNDASVTTTVIEPRLEVTPDVGRPGFVPFAIGTDFPPNAPLELKWSPGLGKREITAGPDGTFRISMLVFPNDTVGPRQLLANALAPEVPATNFLATGSDFLVVPPSTEPFQVEPQVAVTQLVQRSG